MAEKISMKYPFLREAYSILNVGQLQSYKFWSAYARVEQSVSISIFQTL